MGFQKAVVAGHAKGVPGDRASLNPAVYTDRNYLAGDDAVAVGNFVFDNPDNPLPAEYEGSGVLSALSSGSDVLGIVERNLSYVNFDLRSEATLIVPQYAPLQIIVRGDVYAVATTDANKGDAVYASSTDGSISTGSGDVDTGWVVTEGGSAGDIITISNWAVAKGGE